MFLESFVYKLNSEPQDLGKRKKIRKFRRKHSTTGTIRNYTEITVHTLEELRFFKDKNFKILERNSTTLPNFYALSQITKALNHSWHWIYHFVDQVKDKKNVISWFKDLEKVKFKHKNSCNCSFFHARFGKRNYWKIVIVPILLILVIFL